jgi:hypothetical protein
MSTQPSMAAVRIRSNRPTDDLDPK